METGKVVGWSVKGMENPVQTYANPIPKLPKIQCFSHENDYFCSRFGAGLTRSKKLHQNLSNRFEIIMSLTKTSKIPRFARKKKVLRFPIRFLR